MSGLQGPGRVWGRVGHAGGPLLPEETRPVFHPLTSLTSLTVFPVAWFPPHRVRSLLLYEAFPETGDPRRSSFREFRSQAWAYVRVGRLQSFSGAAV